MTFLAPSSHKFWEAFSIRLLIFSIGELKLLVYVANVCSINYM